MTLLEELRATIELTMSEDALAGFDALLQDKVRLDFLQREGGGRQWVSRPSSTGRGYRVYTETSRQSSKSVREAIDADLRDVEKNLPIWERQKLQ